MSQSRIKRQYYEFLIVGFIRELQECNRLMYDIPLDISLLIIMFYPAKLQFYAIGENRNNVFGTNIGSAAAADLSVWTKLQDLSDKCLDLSSIYINYARIICKSHNNTIFLTGKDFVSEPSTPLKCMTNITEFISNENDNCMEVISTGLWNEHCIFMSSKRNFALFGDNRYNSYASVNISINKSIIVTKIVNGTEHTLFLCKDGSILSYGKNSVGQCGHTTSSNAPHNTVSTPTQIKWNNEDKQHVVITDIAVGDKHNLCITEKGNLYVFGWNEYGQCGMSRGEVRKYDTPTLNNWLSNKLNCKNVVCGAWHSVVIGMHGICYVFGHNGDGQCGNGLDDGKHVDVPLKFEKGNIVDAAAGFRHTVLLTDSNEIYCFGRNNKSQCSVSNTEKKIYSPYLLTRKEIGFDEDVQILSVLATPYSTLIVTR